MVAQETARLADLLQQVQRAQSDVRTMEALATSLRGEAAAAAAAHDELTSSIHNLEAQLQELTRQVARAGVVAGASNTAPLPGSGSLSGTGAGTGTMGEVSRGAVGQGSVAGKGSALGGGSTHPGWDASSEAELERLWDKRVASRQQEEQARRDTLHAMQAEVLRLQVETSQQQGELARVQAEVARERAQAESLRRDSSLVAAEVDAMRTRFVELGASVEAAMQAKVRTEQALAAAEQQLSSAQAEEVALGDKCQQLGQAVRDLEARKADAEGMLSTAQDQLREGLRAVRAVQAQAEDMEAEWQSTQQAVAAELAALRASKVALAGDVRVAVTDAMALLGQFLARPMPVTDDEILGWCRGLEGLTRDLRRQDPEPAGELVALTQAQLAAAQGELAHVRRLLLRERQKLQATQQAEMDARKASGAGTGLAGTLWEDMEEIRAVREHVRGMRRQLAELQGQVAEQEAVFVSLRDECAVRQHLVEELSTKWQDAALGTAQAARGREEVEKKLAARRDELARLEKEIVDKRRGSEAARAEYQAQSSRLTLTTEHADAKVAELAGLRDRVEAMRAELEAVTATKEDFAQQLNEMQARWSAMCQDVDTDSVHKVELEATIARLQGEARQATQDKATAAAKLSHLQDQIHAEAAVLASLQADAAAAGEQLAALGREAAELESGWEHERARVWGDVQSLLSLRGQVARDLGMLMCECMVQINRIVEVAAVNSAPRHSAPPQNAGARNRYADARATPQHQAPGGSGLLEHAAASSSQHLEAEDTAPQRVPPGLLPRTEHGQGSGAREARALTTSDPKSPGAAVPFASAGRLPGARGAETFADQPTADDATSAFSVSSGDSQGSPPHDDPSIPAGSRSGDAGTSHSIYYPDGDPGGEGRPRGRGVTGVAGADASTQGQQNQFLPRRPLPAPCPFCLARAEWEYAPSLPGLAHLGRTDSDGVMGPRASGGTGAADASALDGMAASDVGEEVAAARSQLLLLRGEVAREKRRLERARMVAASMGEMAGGMGAHEGVGAQGGHPRDNVLMGYSTDAPLDSSFAPTVFYAAPFEDKGMGLSLPPPASGSLAPGTAPLRDASNRQRAVGAVDLLKIQLRETREEIRDAEALLARMRMQVAAELSRLDLLQGDCDERRKVARDLQRRWERMLGELGSAVAAKAHADIAEANAHAALARNDDLSLMLANARAESQELRTALAGSGEELLKTQGQVAQQEAQLADLLEALRVARETDASSQAAREVAEGRLAAAVERGVELEREVFHLRGDVARLEEAQQYLQATADQWKCELLITHELFLAAHGDLAGMQAELSAADQGVQSVADISVATLRESLTSLRALRAELPTLRTESTHAIEHLSIRMADKNRQRFEQWQEKEADLASVLAVNEAELAHARGQLAASATREAALSDQVVELAAREAELTDRVGKAVQENDAAAARETQLRSDLDEALTQVLAAEDELALMRADVTAKGEDVARLSRTILEREQETAVALADMQAELARAVAVSEGLREELARCEAEREEWVALLAGKEEEGRGLLARQGALEAKVEERSREVEKAEEITAQLTAEVASLSAHLQTTEDILQATLTQLASAVAASAHDRAELLLLRSQRDGEAEEVAVVEEERTRIMEERRRALEEQQRDVGEQLALLDERQREVALAVDAHSAQTVALETKQAEFAELTEQVSATEMRLQSLQAQVEEKAQALEEMERRRVLVEGELDNLWESFQRLGAGRLQLAQELARMRAALEEGQEMQRLQLQQQRQPDQHQQDQQRQEEGPNASNFLQPQPSAVPSLELQPSDLLPLPSAQRDQDTQECLLPMSLVEAGPEGRQEVTSMQTSGTEPAGTSRLPWLAREGVDRDGPPMSSVSHSGANARVQTTDAPRITVDGPPMVTVDAAMVAMDGAVVTVGAPGVTVNVDALIEHDTQRALEALRRSAEWLLSADTAARDKLALLRRAVEEERGVLAQLEEERELLAIAGREAARQLADAQGQVEVQQGLIEGMRAQWAEQAEQLRREREELEASLADASKAVVSAKRDAAAATERIEGAKSALERVELEADAARADLQRLQEQRATAETQAQEARDAAQAALAQLVQLQEETARLHEDMEGAKRQLGELQEQRRAEQSSLESQASHAAQVARAMAGLPELVAGVAEAQGSAAALRARGQEVAEAARICFEGLQADVDSLLSDVCEQTVRAAIKDAELAEKIQQLSAVTDAVQEKQAALEEIQQRTSHAEARLQDAVDDLASAEAEHGARRAGMVEEQGAISAALEEARGQLRGLVEELRAARQLLYGASTEEEKDGEPQAPSLHGEWASLPKGTDGLEQQGGLQGAIVAARQELEVVSNAVHGMQEELKAVDEEKAAALVQLAQIRADQEAAAACLRVTEASLADARQAAAEQARVWAAEEAALRAECSHVGQLVESTLGRLLELTEELREGHAALAQAVAETSHAAEGVRRLSVTSVELHLAIADARTAHSLVERAVADLSAQASALTEEVGRLSQERDALLAAMAGDEATHKYKQAMWEQEAQAAESTRIETHSLHAQAQGHQAQVQSCRAQLAALEDKERSARAKLDATTAALAAATSACEAAKEGSASISRRAEAMEAAMEKRREALEGKVEALLAEVTEHQTALLVTRAESDRLQGAAREAREQLERAQAEHTALVATHEELLASVERARQQLASDTLEATTRRLERSSLERELAEQETMQQQASLALAHSSAELEATRLSHQRCLEEREVLEASLSQMRAEASVLMETKSWLASPEPTPQGARPQPQLRQGGQPHQGVGDLSSFLVDARELLSKVLVSGQTEKKGEGEEREERTPERPSQGVRGRAGDASLDGRAAGSVAKDKGAERVGSAGTVAEKAGGGDQGVGGARGGGSKGLPLSSHGEGRSTSLRRARSLQSALGAVSVGGGTPGGAHTSTKEAPHELPEPTHSVVKVDRGSRQGGASQRSHSSTGRVLALASQRTSPARLHGDADGMARPYGDAEDVLVGGSRARPGHEFVMDSRAAGGPGVRPGASRSQRPSWEGEDDDDLERQGAVGPPDRDLPALLAARSCLQEELDGLRQASAREEQRKWTLEEEIRGLDTALDATRRQLSDMREAKEALSTRLGDRERQLARVEEWLAQRSAFLADLREDCGALTGRAAALAKKVAHENELDERLGAMEAQLVAEEGLLAQRRAEAEAVEARLVALQADLARGSQEKEDLARAVEDLRDGLKKLARKRQRAVHAQHKAELAESAERASLRAELASLRGERGRLQGDLDETRRQVAEVLRDDRRKLEEGRRRLALVTAALARQRGLWRLAGGDPRRTGPSGGYYDGGGLDDAFGGSGLDAGTSGVDGGVASSQVAAGAGDAEADWMARVSGDIGEDISAWSDLDLFPSHPGSAEWLREGGPIAGGSSSGGTLLEEPRMPGGNWQGGLDQEAGKHQGSAKSSEVSRADSGDDTASSATLGDVLASGLVPAAANALGMPAPGTTSGPGSRTRSGVAAGKGSKALAATQAVVAGNTAEVAATGGAAATAEGSSPPPELDPMFQMDASNLSIDARAAAAAWSRFDTWRSREESRLRKEWRRLKAAAAVLAEECGHQKSDLESASRRLRDAESDGTQSSSRGAGQASREGEAIKVHSGGEVVENQGSDAGTCGVAVPPVPAGQVVVTRPGSMDADVVAAQGERRAHTVNSFGGKEGENVLLATLQAERASILRQRDELAATAAAMDADRAALRLHEEALERRAGDLEAKRRDLEERREALEAEEALFGTKVAAFAAKESALEKRAVVLEERTRSMEAQTRVLEDQTRALAKQTRALEERGGALDAEMDAMEEERGALREKAKALEERARLLEETSRVLDEQARGLDAERRRLDKKVAEESAAFEREFAAGLRSSLAAALDEERRQQEKEAAAARMQIEAACAARLREAEDEVARWQGECGALHSQVERLRGELEEVMAKGRAAGEEAEESRSRLRETESMRRREAGATVMHPVGTIRAGSDTISSPADAATATEGSAVTGHGASVADAAMAHMLRHGSGLPAAQGMGMQCIHRSLADPAGGDGDTENAVGNGTGSPEQLPAQASPSGIPEEFKDEAQEAATWLMDMPASAFGGGAGADTALLEDGALVAQSSGLHDAASSLPRGASSVTGMVGLEDGHQAQLLPGQGHASSDPTAALNIDHETDEGTKDSMTCPRSLIGDMPPSWAVGGDRTGQGAGGPSDGGHAHLALYDEASVAEGSEASSSGSAGISLAGGVEDASFDAAIAADAELVMSMFSGDESSLSGD
eukprot:jgi/Mesvir1/25539/Mv01784-RA.2